MICYTNFIALDLTTGNSLPAKTILVEDGRILELGTIPPASSKEQINLGGAFVMPGLIDMHVHLVWDGQPDPDLITRREPPALAVLRAARNARRSLQGGVTTVRDLGAPHDAAIGVAAAINSGLLEGARVIASGRPIIQTGGHVSSMGREADGSSEIQKAVREQIKLGAQVIKLMCSGGAYGEHEDITDTQLTPEEIMAAANAAHAAGKRVAAHALPAAAIVNAAVAGVDTIEHAALPDEKALRAIVKSGSTVIPTLSPYQGMSLCGPEAGVPMAAILKSRRIMEAYSANLRCFYQAGIPVALGTDAGSPNLPHPVVPHEINLWIREANIPALQALQAATSAAAAALGRSDLGCLQPGAHADLVTYRHNPLEYPSTLHHPSHVIQAGRIIAVQQALWSAVPT